MALDLIEELRPVLADRFVLSLINKKIVKASNFSKKENGAVTIAARAWVKNADYWTVYFDLIKAVNDKFVELNITIPNQQIDIHTK